MAEKRPRGRPSISADGGRSSGRVVIPNELNAALREHARREGVTVSKVVRQVLVAGVPVVLGRQLDADTSDAA